MSGKSPFATDEERRAHRLEQYRLRHLRIKSDPVAYEQFLEKRREDRALASEQRAAAKSMPKPVDAKLYRQHGPWAQLFALQAA
jgi:hypothetical protein